MTGQKTKTLAVGIAIAVLLVAGCGRGSEPVTRPFPMAQVPALVAEDDSGALSYLLEHFWDAFADTTRSYLNDSAHIEGVAAMELESAFAAYINYLCLSELGDAKKSVSKMCDLTARLQARDSTSSVFDSFAAWMENYLYDPNSPYRDEDIYGAYAACLARYEGYSQEKRSIYVYEAGLCSLNERGTQAADFVFRDAEGRDRSLYDIQADYVLLFFSNPGCNACKSIIERLSGTPRVACMIDAGRLAVLNIYIDEDLQSWRDYMPIYPESWYNGYDPFYAIRGETVYNVRAIPSLYLLDADKVVMVKDGAEEMIFSYLDYLAEL